jgi:hypothetical protein
VGQIEASVKGLKVAKGAQLHGRRIAGGGAVR